VPSVNINKRTQSEQQVKKILRKQQSNKILECNRPAEVENAEPIHDLFWLGFSKCNIFKDNHTSLFASQSHITSVKVRPAIRLTWECNGC
jgi:hypothetical protein